MQDAGELGGAAALTECSAAELASRLRVQPLPVQGLIETTFRCNLSCAHSGASWAAAEGV